MRDEAAIQVMIAGIVSEFGNLDYAVNNTVISNENAPFADLDSDNFREMVNINIYGVYFDIKYQLSQMVKQGGSAIVNLCSIMGLNGMQSKTATYR